MQGSAEGLRFKALLFGLSTGLKIWGKRVLDFTT